MNKRSNPFYPQHNATYQRPPPPPPPPPAPSQPYDYSYWAPAPQSVQPPPLHPPLQPGAPIPQWTPSAQPHPGMISAQVPPGQTALYANYGYGGARQPYNWQQRPPIPPQQPRQSYSVPQPYFLPQSQPQSQPHPPPQPQSHSNRTFSASFPQNQSSFRPHQQPMFHPLPPQQSPPHLPPAKRARFEAPSAPASGSQSQNASPQNFSRGGSAPSGSFTSSGRVPTGPSRNTSSRGRGGIGGGPSIGMMRVGAGNNTPSNRGGASGVGGGGGRGGSHGSRGGQIGGYRGGRGNWHSQGHGRRAGGGSSGNSGAARGRGGSFSHSGIVRQNGSMNTSEKERSSGKKEDFKQTLTDFKIIGLEIENMLWKWGVCCNSEGLPEDISADQTESEPKPISAQKAGTATDELKLELSDRVEEIEFGAALKEPEEIVASSSSSAAANHVRSAVVRTEKPTKSLSSQSPPRIRIYFNTPVVTEDVQKSNTINGIVSTRSKRRMPADDKGDEEDEGRRIRAKLNPTSEDSPIQDAPVLDAIKDVDSAPPSIDASVTSIRTEDEGDWLMEAIAKDGDVDVDGNVDGDEALQEGSQEKQPDSCGAEGETDPAVADPLFVQAEEEEDTIVDNVDPVLVEEYDEEVPFDHELAEEIDPLLVSHIELPPSSVPSAADPAEDATRSQGEGNVPMAENEFVSGLDVEPVLEPISPERSQQSSLSQTILPSSSSSTVVATGSALMASTSTLSSNDTDKRRRIPSSNRISILYASGTRRLAINSEIVDAMRIWRGRGRIEISLRLEREGEELKGLFPEVYSTDTQSFAPSSFTTSGDMFPPWSRLITPSKVTLIIHLDKEKPLTEPRWVKTGDLEEWLRNTFGIFWVSGEDGWEKRMEVVDPDPPPTIHTVLENWSNGSLVGLETERQRFIKTHMSESDNLLEILLRLVRGERATLLSTSNNAASSNLHLSGPLLTALSPNSSHAGQQTHLTLAIVAMVRMAESFAVRSSPAEDAKREVDEKVGEIIRCLPQHLLFKSLDGIFREWKDTRKRGGR